MFVITGSATLRELNFSGNDIGDDGMAVISEALQHNKSFTTLALCVNSCEFSVKGTVFRSRYCCGILAKHLILLANRYIQ